MQSHRAFRGAGVVARDAARADGGDRPTALVGQSAPMRELRAALEAVAPHDCTVLLVGESGAGKEVVARLLHEGSRRSAGPFVPVDCATLRDTLIESQLFGHVRGAFTGADRASVGFVRAANGGTLFLDEIGELPLAGQSKLLRCLQERTLVPVGAVEGVRVDVRVVAATHRDLRAMVRAGAFREDLYYRLNVLRLRVPPLRERPDDVPLLADYLLRELALETGEPPRRLSGAAAAALQRHDWPGNVRELANALERGAVVARGALIEVADLPEEIAAPGPGDGPLSLAAAERRAILEALARAGGDRRQAARLLRIDPRRLARKLRAHRIEQGAAPAEARDN
jgi:DNA-binding NtrC family response regulator